MLRPRESLRLVLRERGSIQDYLLAIVSAGLAYTLTSMLSRHMQGIVTPLFFGAVTLAAWAGGFWPGVSATLLGILAIEQILVPERLFAGSEVLGLMLFAIISVAISTLNGLRKVTQDVLRRQQLELELRVTDRTRQLLDTNQRLQELFEQAPIAYHEIDRQGLIRRVNRAECELLEYTPEELLGKPVWELVSPEQRELSRREVMRKAEGGKTGDGFTREYVTKSGKRILVEIHERAIAGPTGEVLGIRSALLDITDRVRAEEHIRKLNLELEQRVQARTAELQRSNDALQQFAYSASHDLQEPLRMVAAYTRLLERRYKDLFDEEGREYLHYVVDGAERMSRLIHDLLAFSRAGNVAPEADEEIDMHEVLSTAMQNLHTAIEESKAVIEASDLPRVRARRAGLAQVFHNLLSNSIKYRSTEPPRIAISCIEKSEEWVFCVADNGAGFEQAQAERVFGVFQRLHGRSYPGTGIGLAICKRIIERNGGRMWAESSPGAGARFYFTLPRTEAEDSTATIRR